MTAERYGTSESSRWGREANTYRWLCTDLLIVYRTADLRGIPAWEDCRRSGGAWQAKSGGMQATQGSIQTSANAGSPRRAGG